MSCVATSSTHGALLATSSTTYNRFFLNCESPMAARGATSADFGRTNSSKKFFRTRGLFGAEPETTDDVNAEHPAAVSSAAASYLASLRAELAAPKRAEIASSLPAPRPAKPKAAAATLPPPRPAPSAAASLAAPSDAVEVTAPSTAKKDVAPVSEPTSKRHLSKAERRAAKKRRRQESGE